jgi:hypothetical protein
MGAFDKYHVSSARNACINMLPHRAAARKLHPRLHGSRVRLDCCTPSIPSTVGDASRWHAADGSLARRFIPRLACPLLSNKQTQTPSVCIPAAPNKSNIYVAAMPDCTQHTVVTGSTLQARAAGFHALFGREEYERSTWRGGVHAASSIAAERCAGMQHVGSKRRVWCMVPLCSPVCSSSASHTPTRVPGSRL